MDLSHLLKPESVTVNQNIDPNLEKAFCEDWPIAKPVLQAMEAKLPNFLWKLVLGSIIAEGDFLHSQCPVAETPATPAE